MKNDQKILLVEVDNPPFISQQDDDEGKIDDYFSEFIEIPVYDHIDDVIDRFRMISPYAVFQQGFLTRGQWLLYTVGLFYGQGTNGGLAQFFFNKQNLISDVPIALELLDLHDFRSAYLALLDQIRQELITNHGIDPDKPIFRQVLLMDRNGAIEDRVKQQVKDSGLDDHFVMKWDNERDKLYWPPELWSQQMISRTTEYVENHPSEFQRLQA